MLHEEEVMLTPEPSTHSFRTVDITVGGQGDDGSSSNDLGEEWTVRRVNGLHIPFASGQPKKKRHTSNLNGVQAAGDADADGNGVNSTTNPVSHFLPFQCSICFGPVIQATLPRCGHMFCKECTGECKKRINACPVCRGSLSILTRAYTIDDFMEKYFRTVSTVEERQKYMEAKKKRIAELIREMEQDKKSFFRPIRMEWERTCFTFKAKGWIGGTARTLRRLTGIRIPRLALGFGIGLLTGLFLVSTFSNDMSKGLWKFWWEYFLSGIRDFGKSQGFSAQPETTINAVADPRHSDLNSKQNDVGGGIWSSINNLLFSWLR